MSIVLNRAVFNIDLGPVYMEWGTPVKWGRFLLFCVPQSLVRPQVLIILREKKSMALKELILGRDKFLILHERVIKILDFCISFNPLKGTAPDTTALQNMVY